MVFYTAMNLIPHQLTCFVVLARSEVMWNAATIAEVVHDMHHYGFKADEGAISFDWSFIKNNRDKYIERLNGIYDSNLENSGVTKILGTASLGIGSSDSNSKIKSTP